MQQVRSELRKLRLREKGFPMLFRSPLAARARGTCAKALCSQRSLWL